MSSLFINVDSLFLGAKSTYHSLPLPSLAALGGSPKPEQLRYAFFGHVRVGEEAWVSSINARLQQDCSKTGRKWEKKALPVKMVLNTWKGFLRDEDRLPDDWTGSTVVLKTIDELQADFYEDATVLFAVADLLDPINLHPDDDDNPDELPVRDDSDVGQNTHHVPECPTNNNEGVFNSGYGATATAGERKGESFKNPGFLAFPLDTT
ncbi:hypothetical protein C8R43DRAFT_951583 [Mycena crocata]|nr:hypothetical protein C8R43DRAFT_951583 [Mycena crocata]